ncbi:MAG: dockerin type I domain-containing protein [Pirellulaceae bacterium]
MGRRTVRSTVDAAGAGQLGYRIAKYNTSNMAIEGTFDTGPYPREIVFSPDDTVAYTVNAASEIKTWDTNFFASRGTIRVEGKAEELWVERSGRYLFAAFDNEVRVYSTGRSIDQNVGDTDGNGYLDPGETWRYESKSVAKAGLHEHQIAVAGKSSNGELSAGGSKAAYFGTFSLEVKENVTGVEVIRIPGVQGTVLDDPRFEIVDDLLRTRLDEHLTASIDNGMRLRLLNESTQEVLHIVYLAVQADSVPWHNQNDPTDVNEDGLLTPVDVLLVVNYINTHGARSLAKYPVGTAPQIDCNGDGFLSPLDALLVVNALNESARAEGENQAESAAQSSAQVELDHWAFFPPMLSTNWSNWPDHKRSKGTTADAVLRYQTLQGLRNPLDSLVAKCYHWVGGIYYGSTGQTIGRIGR